MNIVEFLEARITEDEAAARAAAASDPSDNSFHIESGPAGERWTDEGGILSGATTHLWDCEGSLPASWPSARRNGRSSPYSSPIMLPRTPTVIWPFMRAVLRIPSTASPPSIPTTRTTSRSGRCEYAASRWSMMPHARSLFKRRLNDE